MVVKEYYMTRSDGVVLNRTYSDIGMLIQKVGTDELYGEAIDVENAPYEYVETDQKAEEESEEIDQEEIGVTD